MPALDPSDATGRQDLTGELRDARPAADPVGIEEVRANVERALFGRSETARIDRFELRKPIAGGGMGMIHRAYDPKLERDVALKLLHPRLHGAERAKERLIAEARVLARLSDPNVVPIYEVVEVAEQVVIVMELVDGQTLFEWERQARRGWREVVAVYAQAARGLVAAHKLGIVHRDFKPANAIIGIDGRVRVLDFGLARLESSGEANQLPIATGSPELTATGEVLGTVAYMAPEQLAGDTATAASDQFSFCVALHRAMYGSPPFVGANMEERQAAIARGYLAPAPGVKLPAWLRAVIARGLALTPEDRYPSMLALLADLEREHGWRRWRMLIVVSAAAIAVAGALVLTLEGGGTPRTPTCDETIATVDRIWNSAQASQIQAAFDRVGTPYAGVAKAQVSTLLDNYRDRWSSTHRAACVAQRAAPEDVKLAAEYLRKRTCLDRRLQDLSNAIEVLAEVDAPHIANAVDVAAGLPAVEECADADGLPDEPVAPPSASSTVRVAAMRAQLSRASALERAGRSDAALALAEHALADAQQIGYVPAVLDATLEKGTLLLFRYDFEEAIPPLTLAEELANEQRQFRLALVAGARRLYAEGVQGLALDRLAGRAQALELFSRGLPNDHFTRPLLLNYIGVVYMTRDEPERARSSFEAASRTRGAMRSTDRELAGIDMNLAMMTHDHAERERLSRASWKGFEAQLGPTHLTTLMEECRYAHYTRNPAVALQLTRDAGEKLRIYHPTSVQVRVACLAYQAMLTLEIDDSKAALALYDEVLALTRGLPDPERPADARIAAGYAKLLRSEFDGALATFVELTEKLGESPNWWEKLPAAEGDLGAAIVELALVKRAARSAQRAEHSKRARQYFEHSVLLFEAVAERSEDLGVAARLALARASLARLLVDTDARRSLQLADQARGFYRDANPTAFRAQLDALP